MMLEEVDRRAIVAASGDDTSTCCARNESTVFVVALYGIIGSSFPCRKSNGRCTTFDGKGRSPPFSVKPNSPAPIATTVAEKRCGQSEA
ncbi:MAG: hypothetical protein ABI446_06785 [Gemmatimonadaceae bacterium]